MSNFSSDFIRFAVDHGVLCFGEFKTKAGRISPYFFNAGLFHNGDSIKELGEFYAKAIVEFKLHFDILYGPAYKGIPLVTAVAIALAKMGRNMNFCFNRKEAKDHGEKGNIIGAPLSGRVLIIDDVVSAGTSIAESVETIRTHKAEPCGVLIALDRQERGGGTLSAIQEIEKRFAIPVYSIANLDHVVDYLRSDTKMGPCLLAIEQYRKQYGVMLHANA